MPSAASARLTCYCNYTHELHETEGPKIAEFMLSPDEFPATSEAFDRRGFIESVSQMVHTFSGRRYLDIVTERAASTLSRLRPVIPPTPAVAEPV